MNKLILSFALIFGTSVLVNAQIEKGPKIEFSKEVHDYGNIKYGGEPNCTFEFKNTGNEPLIITNAKGSCGCTVPSWPKEPIAPGKSGEIKVVFDSNGKSGAQSKRVTIVSNTNPPESFLYLEGDVTGSAPQGN